MPRAFNQSITVIQWQFMTINELWGSIISLNFKMTLVIHLHTAGPPTDNAMKSNFEDLCKWLDEQTELLTVSKLYAKMCSFAEKDLNVYCWKWMKKQLEQHYQNPILLNLIVRRTRPFEGSLFYTYGKCQCMLSEQ